MRTFHPQMTERKHVVVNHQPVLQLQVLRLVLLSWNSIDQRRKWRERFRSFWLKIGMASYRNDLTIWSERTAEKLFRLYTYKIRRYWSRLYFLLAYFWWKINKGETWSSKNGYVPEVYNRARVPLEFRYFIVNSGAAKSVLEPVTVKYGLHP